MRAVGLLTAASIAACSPARPVPPLDDVLRLNHVQSEGTHNSYHVEPTEIVVDEWRYTHAPLDVQLESQGVRHFELDVHRDEPAGPFLARHLAYIDPVSNCPELAQCFDAVARWSRAHPLHSPITIIMELRVGFDEATVEGLFEDLDALVRTSFGDLLFEPDALRGDAATIRDVIRAEGWPTLAVLRGKVIVALNEGGDFRRTYTRGDAGLDGRAMFVTAEPEHPYAALIKRDEPTTSADDIRALVEEGFVVRTRSDSCCTEAWANDRSRLDVALASGAQLVSTDFPAPVDGVDYFVELPGGTPSRCSPVGAPAECTSLAIEDPEWLAWRE
ncbi:phosphatidylinositol-specific phospholipase C1-like protein [Myxococcota bacterium]|nr:phosphatidylinositol-specific phospholipase C1-like protein [Myxococcota bacterium]